MIYVHTQTLCNRVNDSFLLQNTDEQLQLFPLFSLLQPTMQSVLYLLLVPLLAVYLYSKLRYMRLSQYREFPQLEPSLVWGHMKALYAAMKRGPLDRHFGQCCVASTTFVSHLTIGS